MRILLFGKGGQLGRHLCRLLERVGSLRALGRDEADLAEPARAADWIRRERPDVVINAAAYTAVDRAESEPELAMRINGEAPAAMAHAAAEAGALFIHYSTDYVFDGRTRSPYTEDAPTAPASVYGRTKLAGEEGVRRAGGKWLVFRTAWVYSLVGRNFLKTVLRLAAERRELRIVDDQVGSPTFAGALADATAEVLARLREAGGLDAARSGIYHMTCAGETSWCGFARRIVERAGLDGVTVRPIASSEYPTPAARPAYSVLSCARLRERFGVALPRWEQALDACLAGRDGVGER